jgi:hypothetical protein
MIAAGEAKELHFPFVKRMTWNTGSKSNAWPSQREIKWTTCEY